MYIRSLIYFTMKTIIYSIMATSMIVLLGACGSPEKKANDHAEEICECLQDAGLDNSLSLIKLQDRRYMNEMEDKMEKTVPKCMLAILKEMDEEISELSKKEKKEYTKAFLKGCIDTECADIALDLIPYDMLGIALGEAERQIERQEEYREERESREMRRDIEELEDLF